MQIKKQNAVVEFFKRFWAYILSGTVAFAVAITFLVVGLTSVQPLEEVSTPVLTFSLPMTNATVLVDYSDSELQENVTLGEWSAHLSIDLISDDNLVYSVLSGEVTAVDTDYLEGCYVTITHDDGFVSVYASLSEDVLVSVGDQVSAGQQIGTASTTAAGESQLGEHLHFTLYLNDEKVDPNNYIELQSK